MGLRTLLARGLSDGLILVDGSRFHLRGLRTDKGPYQWFGNYRWRSGPHPNWEYFVHVAEYVRLHRIAVALDLTLAFEDRAMDLALYQGNTLLVCVEVKERADRLHDLMKRVRDHGARVNFDGLGDGDAARKAQYIARGRPQYFAGVAIGSRLEYRVEYQQGEAFLLAEDVIPWV